MDETEDTSYLTLLNDGTHNYLLQTNEETLEVQNSNMNVEPMFTDDGIENDNGVWPILMNGNLISEVTDLHLQSTVTVQSNNHHQENPVEISNGLPEVYENTLQNSNITAIQEGVELNQIKYPMQVPGKGFITADGLFITNDILLPLKLDENNLNISDENYEVITKITNENDILINPKTLTPDITLNEYNSDPVGEEVQETLQEDRTENNCTENERVFNFEHLNNLGGVIRLLYTDGTAININKKHLLNNNLHKEKLSTQEQLVKISEDNIYDIIKAYRCKKCSFLSEDKKDVLEHWTAEHALQEIQMQTEEKQQQMPNSKNTEEQQNGFIKTHIVNGDVKMKSIIKNGNHQTIYLCSECNFAYASTEKLKHHMITAHKLIQKPSDIINIVNKKQSKEKLTAAILEKRAKASKKIKCSVKGCDLRFAMDDMRLRHENCHVEGQKKQFKCFECDTKFSIWRVCNMHLWKCHKMDLGLFTCPMCSEFKASSASRLLRHMEIHEEERPYICSECGKTFKQNSQLRNHQVLHKTLNSLPDWAVQRQCDICKKYFANSKSLKKHVQIVHDKFKPFICNICGHKTARKAMLNLHLRQHTGEKPHQCPICDYRTGDHNSLRRHIMRHSGDTKYSCPHCSYTSIQSVSYKYHIANKHPGLGGSYFCSLCSYHTVNENAYFGHLIDHKNGLIKDNTNNDENGEILSKVIELVEDKTASNEQISKKFVEEEDETENYLLQLDHSNDAIDTGGITIPAGAPLNITY